jgi:hypothetical protein
MEILKSQVVALCHEDIHLTVCQTKGDNFSMRNFLTLILFLYSTLAYSVSVQMSDTSDPVVYGTTTSGANFLLTAESSGDGSTKEAAYKVYMPFSSTAGSDQNLYHHLVSSGIPGKATAGGMTFSLELDDDGDADYILYAAIRNGDDTTYRLINSVSETTPLVNMADICTVSSDLSNCTSLDTADTTVNDTYIYLFYTKDTLSQDQDITIASYTNGIFVRVYFSSDVDDYDQAATSNTRISSLVGSRGDATAYLDFAGTINVTTYMNGTIVYSGGSLYDTYDTGTNETGEIEVQNLTNGTTFTLSVAFKDKFGFRTNVGDVLSVNVTPTEVEKLLEEKSCYLVTAGFQRDHYVLDYFRHIRDSYLLTNPLGESIVNVYYSTAPKYASFIYKNKVLSLFVRGLSYVIYAFLKYFLWIAGAILLATIALRIKVQWQREFS